MTFIMWVCWAMFGLVTGVLGSFLWYRLSKILSVIAVIPFMYCSGLVFQGDWLYGILSLAWLIPTYGMRRDVPSTSLRDE